MEREKHVAPLASEEQGRLPIWHHMVVVSLSSRKERRGKRKVFRQMELGEGKPPTILAYKISYPSSKERRAAFIR